MKWPVDCLGCSTKLRQGDSAIHVTHVDDAQVSMTWHMCEPCLIRMNRDPAFAARFEKLTAVLTGSIEA